MKQRATEWLDKILEGQKDKPFDYDEWKIAIEHAMVIEDDYINNLPIHIHEGINNTWVYIEDGVVHVKLNNPEETNEKPPCNLDHNGECLVCDCWISNCAYLRYLNGDYEFETKEELEQMFKKD